ncbi:VOC family protein [Exiguobacterium artemiae]|uniref:VOC family protein n=1 Tax=Exiguobacterium artemiae TaxID=340145 RepID=UPI0029644B2E|nr:hypothetical protein [Exiguobacterium sibiricum]MDW2886039.1 hypothetical protein [Exiguobacterium sibiricum]
MLFHYHLWTPFVEDTERFYQQLGFQVTQRIGKYAGEFTSFDPPLDWDDFREQQILFRIIEMKRGTINITFGYGKKVMFDHIGFLVTEADRLKVLDRAEDLGLTIQANERRTFIGTPFGFRIELQTHPDAVESETGDQLLQLGIATPTPGLEPLLSQLLARPVPEITTSVSERIHAREVVFSGTPALPVQDPNGLAVRTVS